MTTDLKRLEEGLPHCYTRSQPAEVTMCVQAKPLQSCPALCDPMDNSLPGTSVHEILQA